MRRLRQNQDPRTGLTPLLTSEGLHGVAPEGWANGEVHYHVLSLGYASDHRWQMARRFLSDADIVSDLLGITTASAASWSRLAGGEWSDYPALRSTRA
ncbi:hypothetical protein [Microbacterium amylolyticum]|uniref:Uncharacterized protein n=1 Tax=Microbacterium amylolyticum TaxID=936337 RepID=A0ABS4ZIL4_9MICO|nr:hypothetical protein [Microbacterium amylolyticum]MBP2437125.1 hypothetical protein [Microbacterium amylolyticum]